MISPAEKEKLRHALWPDIRGSELRELRELLEMVQHDMERLLPVVTDMLEQAYSRGRLETYLEIAARLKP